MDEKIKIQIFGFKDEEADSGCEKKKKGSSKGCGGCGSGGHTSGCTNCIGGDEGKAKNMQEILKDLSESIQDSDIKECAELEFIDLGKISAYEYENIEQLLEQGFTTPIVVIDGIVRYYGGISFRLIYNDVKELVSQEAH